MVVRLAAHWRPEILLAKLWIMKMLKSPASQLIVIKVMITFVRASAPKTRRAERMKNRGKNHPIGYKKRGAVAQRICVSVGGGEPHQTPLKRGILSHGRPLQRAR